MANAGECARCFGSKTERQDLLLFYLNTALCKGELRKNQERTSIPKKIRNGIPTIFGVKATTSVPL
ncbi:MAG: hypothetical protein CVU57_31140 [Deltaproteobacteria bacterium HGW-Deltaproteobacteria-15]|nr:MAG: hypothetical protein CVU57_31140 [Deltaproteobacteria bacterium HGW-Deltaproteobacteria-15]